MMGWFSGCCGFSGLGGFGSFGWIGLIFNLAIIVIVISLIVWVVRRFTAGGSAFTSLQAPAGNPGYSLCTRRDRPRSLPTDGFRFELN